MWINLEPDQVETFRTAVETELRDIAEHRRKYRPADEQAAEMAKRKDALTALEAGQEGARWVPVDDGEYEGIEIVGEKLTVWYYDNEVNKYLPDDIRLCRQHPQEGQNAR